MKLQNQSKKPLKGKRRQKILPREVQFHQNLESTLKKKHRNKYSKNRKKSQESISKTKSTEEKINCDPKAPKMVARF